MSNSNNLKVTVLSPSEIDFEQFTYLATLLSKGSVLPPDFQHPDMTHEVKKLLRSGTSAAIDRVLSFISANITILIEVEQCEFELELKPLHWVSIFQKMQPKELKLFIDKRTLNPKSPFIWNAASGIVQATSTEQFLESDLHSASYSFWSNIIPHLHMVYPDINSHFDIASSWERLVGINGHKLATDIDKNILISNFVNWLEPIDVSSICSYSTLFAHVVEFALCKDSSGLLLKSIIDAFSLPIKYKNANAKHKILPTVEIIIELWKWYAPLVSRIVEHQAEGTSDIICTLWPFDSWESKFDVISNFIGAFIEDLFPRLMVPISFEIGMLFFKAGSVPDANSILEYLHYSGIQVSSDLIDDFIPLIELWAKLRTTIEYYKDRWDHRIQIDWMQQSIMNLAKRSPKAWALALPWLLARAHQFHGLIESVTLETSIISTDVLLSLRRATITPAYMVINNLASGLINIVDGIGAPAENTIRDLISFIAQFLDGKPIFPHPLTVPSLTWIGDANMERTLNNNIRSATHKFMDVVKDEGRLEEPLLTAKLVSELEFSFRNTDLNLRSIGKSQLTRPFGTISLDNRLIPNPEEKEWGCDLALVISGNISGNVRLESAELVQIKKTQRLWGKEEENRTLGDSWRIDIDQLKKIVTYSQTASYWLIAEHGEILVVPGRMLVALMKGMKKEEQHTFTIGYYQVRSMAIPLEEYLVNLVLGAWVGTCDANTLRFARGEDAYTRPRHILGIVVHRIAREGQQEM